MRNLKKETALDIREIVFCGDEENSFCDIFVYEPENVDERELGNLYIVGELVNLSENSSYLVNLLASIIKKEFYSKPKRPTMESLEAGLHKANSTLSNLAEQGNIDWVGNLNMICGAYKRNELYFSQVGNAKTLLVRESQITDIGKSVVKEERPHPFKTFTNIASGEIEKNDLILFATPEFFNIFSLEKTRQLASSLNMEELAEVIQDTIEQEENVGTVGLLAVKMKNGKQSAKEEEFAEKEFDATIKPEVEKITVKAEKEECPAESVSAEKTVETKPEAVAEKIIAEQTDVVNGDIINDDDIIDGKKRITLDDIINRYEEAEKEKPTPEQKFEQKLKATAEKREEKEVKKDFEEIENGRSVMKKLKDLLRAFGKLFGFVNQLKDRTASYFKNYRQKQKQDGKDDYSSDQKTESELLQKINLPTNKNKFILIAFVFIVLLFSGNLIFTEYKKEVEETFSLYNNKLLQAEEKISKAEEVMIYNDLEQARIFLADAKNLALEIKNDYDKLDAEAESLLDKIQNQLDVVDLVNRTDNPEVAIDLKQAAEISGSERLMFIAEKYYIATSENSVYQINLTDKTAVDLQVKSTDIESARSAVPMEKTEEIIFLSDANKLSVLALGKKEIAPASIEPIDGDSEIKDISSYSNYLYLLRPDANQIYKYLRTAAGFGNGKPWITDPEADARNAISIAIDGHIYILRSDGAVAKYLSGIKKDFDIEKLSDPISSSAKIYTNADLEHLYIIDPSKQRIVLFNKTNGSLIGQYTGAAFTDLKNIVVNKTEDRMYVLNGDKIFVIGVKIEG